MKDNIYKKRKGDGREEQKLRVIPLGGLAEI